MVVRTSSSRRGILKKAKPITAEQWSKAREKVLRELERKPTCIKMGSLESKESSNRVDNYTQSRFRSIKEFIKENEPSHLRIEDIAKTSQEEFNWYLDKLSPYDISKGIIKRDFGAVKKWINTREGKNALKKNRYLRLSQDLIDKINKEGKYLVRKKL